MLDSGLTANGGLPQDFMVQKLCFPHLFRTVNWGCCIPFRKNQQGGSRRWFQSRLKRGERQGIRIPQGEESFGDHLLGGGLNRLVEWNVASGVGLWLFTVASGYLWQMYHISYIIIYHHISNQSRYIKLTPGRVLSPRASPPWQNGTSSTGSEQCQDPTHLPSGKLT